MKRVYIEWLDSFTIPSDEWHSAEAMEAEIQPVIVHTVGFLYRVDRDYIVVVNSVSNEGLYWGVMVILKKVIIKARELK